jgi:hypothetical protein
MLECASFEMRFKLCHGYSHLSAFPAESEGTGSAMLIEIDASNRGLAAIVARLELTSTDVRFPLFYRYSRLAASLTHSKSLSAFVSVLWDGRLFEPLLTEVAFEFFGAAFNMRSVPLLDNHIPTFKTTTHSR